MSRRLGIALTVAVLVAATGGIAGLRASGAPLCGLTRLTDRVLDCPRPAPQPSTQPQPPSQPQPNANAPAQLAPTGPVIQTSTTPEYVPDTLIVRFARGTTTADANAVLARIGAHPLRAIGELGTQAVKIPQGTTADALAKLEGSPHVAAATRDEVLHVLAAPPNDANYNLQWGLPLAGFPAAWARTRGSRSVIVAVLDTGVNGTVPDLRGNVKRGIDLTGTGPTDVDGHGTAVAGVIAAHANNGLGGAGVCPNCTILPIKVMGNDGNGDLATVAQGIVKAANLHAKVIDLSLGGPAGLDALRQAVDYATGKGAIVVAAAGNSGRGTPFYPANYPNVIGVAGTNQSDHLYSWSERGTWVRVAAPGCNVAPLTRGGYGMFCGTSSATPLVAGLAGLALSYKPHLSKLRIANAIESTAHKIGSTAGHGRIDAAAALAQLAR